MVTVSDTENELEKMIMFKKTLTFIAAAALVLTMVGCSNQSTDATETKPSATKPSATESTNTQTTTPSATEGTTAKG